MVRAFSLSTALFLSAALFLFSGCVGSRPPALLDRTAIPSEEEADAPYPEDPVDSAEYKAGDDLIEPPPSIFEREHDTLSIWRVPDWDPVEVGSKEEVVLDSAAVSAELTQLINGFRRGAHGGELLPQLRQLEKFLTDDSLRSRAAWLVDRIVDRDTTWMIEQLAQIDLALNEGRLDAARKINHSLERNTPQLIDDSRWIQRRGSIEKMENQYRQQCAPAECDRLRLEAEALFSQKKFEDSLQKARLATAAPDDQRREKGWKLLHNSGNAFCEAQRALAIESIRKHQKSKEEAELIDAKNLLEKCLSIYPEYPQRAKIERDLQTIQRLTKQ